MKLKHLAVLSLTVGAAFGTTAMAADSTVTFKGEVLSSTCMGTIGTSANGVVKLSEIVPSMFPQEGDTAGEKPFTIQLTGCQGSPGLIAKAYFWQPNAQGGRLSKTDGTGSGWTYELLSGASGIHKLTVGNNGLALTTDGADPGADVSTGSGVLTYRVRYRREAAALVPGTLNAKATYVIYNN